MGRQTRACGGGVLVCRLPIGGRARCLPNGWTLTIFGDHMKILLVISCLLITTAAFGQAAAGAYVMDNQARMVAVPSHPETASAQPMGASQNLLGSTGYSSAHGERPLWEVATKKPEVPLGDIARTLRKEKEATKRATLVREN